MNHKNLFYFWKVAKAGSVVKAADAINVTPQTLSGQIGLLEESLGAELFSRQGRSLVLTDAGKLALEYAEELFALSAELETALRHFPHGRQVEFRVGVSDAVPKSLATKLLRPVLEGAIPPRLVCREWQLDRLLGQLAVHQLDMVISDAPLPASYSVKAYNHHLLESEISILAAKAFCNPGLASFPDCLDTMPLLLPGEDSAVHRTVKTWLERKRIRPRIVGEFDDIALMTAFGEDGLGAFPIPSVVESEFMATGKYVLLGRSPEMRIGYFAISVERRLSHPCVMAVTASAQRLLSSLQDGSGR